MIPKVLHLYWGRNKPLSWMRMFTVLSFAHFNPDWKICVWQPIETSDASPWKEQQADPITGRDWFDELSPYAEICTFDFALLGIPPETPEVIKSDCLRWHLLHTFGGLWSDFDIVYVKPMWEPGASADAWLSQHTDFRGQPFFTIGFMLAAAGCPFIGAVLREALDTFNPSEYQSAGSEALGRCITRIGGIPSYVKALPASKVYPVASWHDRRLFSGEPLVLEDDTVGIHWWAGSWRTPKDAASIHPGNMYGFSGPLFQHVQRVYDQMNQQRTDVCP